MTATIPERVPLGTSTLNRDWYVDVDTASSTATPEWVGLFGMTNLQPALSANMQDDGDFDSGGWDSQTKTSQGWSLVATVARKLQADTAAYDPGQEFLRNAADKYGTAGRVHVRWYKMDDARAEAYDGWASVQWAPQGGDRNGLDTVQVTLTGQGPRNDIDHPAPLAPAWQASHAYALNDEVTVSGGAVLEATVAGTSGATEPAAPATVGDTVVDNTVTWTRLS